MNWKTILVLLLICLGLGSYLFLESKKKPADTSFKRNYLLTTDLDNVTAVRASLFDTTFLIEKKFTEWVMRKPNDGQLADSLLIHHLLRVLNRVATLGNVPADSIDLGLAMLDPPAVSFTVYTEDGDSTFLGFGVLNPTTENIYVRRNNEDRVWLIGREVGPMLAFNSFMIRGKGLTAFHPFYIQEIRYSSQGRKIFSAYRSPETKEWWTESNREKISMDKRLINGLLSDIYSNQVREFRALDEAGPSQTGLDRPLRRLWLVSESGDTTAIALGRPLAGREYLRWAGSSLYPDNLLLVDSRLISRLDDFNIEYMRNLKMTNFQATEVDRIELFSPMDSIVIIAEDDTLWRIIKPEEIRCRLWQVERLLTHADTIGAFEILSSSAGKGFDHPQLELNLFTGDSVLVSLQAGDYAGEKEIYMRDRLRDVVYLTKASQIERLTYTFKDLADIPVRHIVK